MYGLGPLATPPPPTKQKNTHMQKLTRILANIITIIIIMIIIEVAANRNCASLRTRQAAGIRRPTKAKTGSARPSWGGGVVF